MARNDSRKRGAAPRGSQGGGRRWPLFAAGVVVGIALSGAVYLAGLLPTAMDLRAKADAAAAADPGAGGEQATPAAAKPAGDAAKKPVTFEFYSILPQQEAVAPVTGNRTTVAPTPPPSPESTATAESPKPRYQLQAGSFRTRAEADRRRAELLLGGHAVTVQDATTANGDQWFRVMVGPFADEGAMQKARQQLASGGVETLPIRLR